MDESALDWLLHEPQPERTFETPWGRGRCLSRIEMMEVEAGRRTLRKADYVATLIEMMGDTYEVAVAKARES